MQTLRGSAASPGVARGRAVLIRQARLPAGGAIEPGQAEAELARLAEAGEAAATALSALASDVGRSHPDEAGIFEAQAAMARDPVLRQLAEERIRGGQDAVAAIQAAAGELADQLRSLDDELLAARAVDVADVAGRIVAELEPTAAAGVATLVEPSVVVAEDLVPSVTAGLPRELLLGIALETGSPTAHAAILARAYGIPAVVGVAGLTVALRQAGDGTEIALDGTSGEVVIAPDRETTEAIDRRAAAFRGEAASAIEEASVPAVTRDGTEVALLANIGTPAEAQGARAVGARGVGLFRTEFLFVERPNPPGEEEQAAAYAEVARLFAPDPVVIRLLDVGGDKPIPYLPIPHEANPFLGQRALRLAGERPELFVGQLRAAMRAAAGLAPGVIKVMAPMVADAEDAALLLRLAQTARAGLEAEGVEHAAVSLGVMLEIPSAILVGRGYFERIGFASLGTNDLTQYTLAADRGNPHLGRYQDALHPAVLRLVAAAVAAAEQAGIELSVCGEMAGDPPAALALVGLGIRRLSMAAVSIGPVRRAVRGVELGELREAATAALEMPSAREVRERFAAFLASAPRSPAAGSGAPAPGSALAPRTPAQAPAPRPARTRPSAAARRSPRPRRRPRR